MRYLTPLSRKILLNKCSSWQFWLAINIYPIIVYINLHNINNKQLHEVKNYISSFGGAAQVVSSNQLTYLFQDNIKFKFLITGNIVALMFNQWPQVWEFSKHYAHIIIYTISVKGTFLNICDHAKPINLLQKWFNQNFDLMVKMTLQLSYLGNDIYNYLNNPIYKVVNDISLVLYKLAQNMENLRNISKKL